MADSSQLRPMNSESKPAEGLARTYSALIDEKAWEVDVTEAENDAVPEAGGAAANPSSLPQIIEALLFAGGTLLTAERAAAALRGLTPAQFTRTIASLNHDYRRQGRPYMIQAQGQGYSLALRPRFRPV